MKPIERLRVVFEASLGSLGANERLPDGRYKSDYVESEWKKQVARAGRSNEIIAMAKKAGARTENWATKLFPVAQVLMTPEELTRFAAMVAAKEREACAQVCDEIQRTKAHKFYGQLLSDGSARQAAAAIRARSAA